MNRLTENLTKLGSDNIRQCYVKVWADQTVSVINLSNDNQVTLTADEAISLRDELNNTLNK